MARRGMWSIVGAGSLLAASLFAQSNLFPATATGTPAIASGLVTVGGQPVGGVDVQVYAWPNAATLDAIPDGGIADTLFLGETTTASDGSFSVDADRDSIPDSYIDDGNMVSIEIEAQDTLARALFTESVEYVPTPVTMDGAWLLASTTAAEDGSRAPSPDVLIDLGTGVAYDTGNDPAAWIDETGNPLGTTGRAAAATTALMPPDVLTPDDQYPHCYEWQKGAKHLGRPEHFTNVYGATQAKATLWQKNTVTHTLGVGISVDGTFDDIKAGGTVTISDVNGGSASTTGIVDKAEGDAWDVQDWHRVSYDGGCTYTGMRKAYQAYSFMDQGQAYSINHQYFEKSCMTMQYLQTVSTRAARQVTYAAGFNILGTSLSAQSGYDDGTAISFHSTKSSSPGMALCGTNPEGIFVSAQLQAFNQG